MKKILILVVIFLGCGLLQAQDTAQVIAPSKVFEKFVLKELDKSDIKKPVSQSLINNIEVIDLRADTAHLGAYLKGKNKFAWVVTEKNTTVQDLFNNTFASKNGQVKLLAVLKEFWFTESPGWFKDYKGREYFSSGKLVFNCDFFYNENDRYIPMIRIDTTFGVMLPKDKTCPPENLLNLFLEYSIPKIDEAVKVVLTKKRRIEKGDILAASYRKNYHVLSDSILRKGVYMSYAEFLNNAPSITAYTVKTFKDQPPALYIKDEKGNEFLSRTSWGFCDGNSIYINNGGMIYSLAKYNGSFYWLGVKVYQDKSTWIPLGFPVGGGWFVYGTESIGVATKAIQALYRLNLENGNAY